MVKSIKNGHAVVVILVVALLIGLVIIAYGRVMSTQSSKTDSSLSENSNEKILIADPDDLYSKIQLGLEKKESGALLESVDAKTDESLNTVDYLKYDSAINNRIVADSGKTYWVWRSCDKGCSESEYAKFEATRPTRSAVKDAFNTIKKDLLSYGEVRLIEDGVKQGTYIEHDYAVMEVDFKNSTSARLQIAVEGYDGGYFIDAYSYDPEIQDNYLYIREWGVSIGLGEYSDKITFSEPKQYSNRGVARSSIRVKINQQYSQYAECETHIGIERLEDVSDFDQPPKIKLGKYYYYNSGVSECGGTQLSGGRDIVTTSDLQDALDKYGVR